MRVYSATGPYACSSSLKQGSMNAIIPFGICLIGVAAIAASQVLMESPYYVTVTTTAGAHKLPPLTQKASVACVNAIAYARQQGGY